MTKPKEKYLLVVSFLEGRLFPRRLKTKFLIEAKFDGEQLATDPVDHLEALEVNQELAWELDKKALHMHKLQRSCIKAMCYALTSGDDGVVSKEMIGYIVLDVKSAPEGMGKPKWYPLLQPKYPKSKPNLQINVYIESDESQPVQPQTQQSLNNLLEVSLFLMDKIKNALTKIKNPPKKY
jgi:centrosomal protein CEP120